MSKHSFPVQERLKSRKAIESLFEKGNSEFKWPILLLWNISEIPHTPPLQAGFTVSRRNFKKAVQRNLMKRRMREAYRLHKSILIEPLENKQLSLDLMFVYQAKEIKEYTDVEVAVKNLLLFLTKNI